MKRRVDVTGELVRREREKRSWTQEELSERSNLGVRTVRRLEAGEASMDTIRRVADALAQDTRCGLKTSLRLHVRIAQANLAPKASVSSFCG